MKKIILLLVPLIMLSCKSQTEKDNKEKLQSLARKIQLIQQNYNQYKDNLIKSNFGNILNPQRIKNDKDFKESDKIIENAKKALHLFNTKNLKYINYLNTNIKLVKPIDKKGSTQKDIDKVAQIIKLSSKKLEINYKTDSTVISKYYELIEMLKNGDCKYVIKGNNFIFNNKFCLSKFQREITEIQSESLKGIDKNNEYINKIRELYKQ